MERPEGGEPLISSGLRTQTGPLTALAPSTPLDSWRPTNCHLDEGLHYL